MNFPVLRTLEEILEKMYALVLLCEKSYRNSSTDRFSRQEFCFIAPRACDTVMEWVASHADATGVVTSAMQKEAVCSSEALVYKIIKPRSTTSTF